jgi:hypothetical protein
MKKRTYWSIICIFVCCFTGYGAALSAGASTRPNIQKLEDEGTLFTNSHCAGGVCQPSRYFMRNNGVFDREGNKLIAVDQSDGSCKPHAFYHLDRDPGEKNNLVNSPEVRKAINSLLDLVNSLGGL